MHVADAGGLQHFAVVAATGTDVNAAAQLGCPVPGQPGLRAIQVFQRCLDDGLLLRFTGETLALAPPFIATDVEIRSAVDALRRALVATAAQAGQAP